MFPCGEISIVPPVQGLQLAFLEAARGGDLDKSKHLIAQGCSVNVKNQVTIALEQIQSPSSTCTYRSAFKEFKMGYDNGV